MPASDNDLGEKSINQLRNRKILSKPFPKAPPKINDNPKVQEIFEFKIK